MDPLPLKEIAEMSGAKLLRGGGSVRVSRISKDTRTIQPGDLYVALRGDNFDGNLFPADAVARGAAAVLVENETQDQFGVHFADLPLDYQGAMYLEGEVTHAPYFTMTTVRRPAAKAEAAKDDTAKGEKA